MGNIPVSRLTPMEGTRRAGSWEYTKTGGHGRAGLRLAPTALWSEVGYNGPRNGIFDNFVSGIFCVSLIPTW